MIITQKKPLEEVMAMVADAKTVAIIGCGSCAAVCPQNCIIHDKMPFVIEQEHCLHCGNCMTACSVNAVERRQ